MIKVKLEPHEIRQAARTGIERRVQSLSLPDRHGYDDSEDGWDNDIVGAIAECAFCKATGRYWDGGVNTFKEGGDAGDSVEVRWTEPHNNSLIVREDDDDDQWFVLVTGREPTLRIHGYIQGKEAKKKKWRKAPNGREPAYFVPKDELRSFKK